MTVAEHLSIGEVADRTGVATAYALYNLQERGEIVIEPTTVVYEGMIIGENAKPDDLEVNQQLDKEIHAAPKPRVEVTEGAA